MNPIYHADVQGRWNDRKIMDSCCVYGMRRHHTPADTKVSGSQWVSFSTPWDFSAIHRARLKIQQGGTDPYAQVAWHRCSQTIPRNFLLSANVFCVSACNWHWKTQNCNETCKWFSLVSNTILPVFPLASVFVLRHLPCVMQELCYDLIKHFKIH